MCRYAVATSLMALLLAPLSWSAPPPPADGSLEKRIEAFTGSHTRCAWVRDGDLVVLDTRDGKGEVEYDFKPQASRPVITPGGGQVVFICYDEWASYIVNWDGSGLKKLVEGRVTSVRRDPEGREWAYWQAKDNEMRTAPLTAIDRSTVVWTFPFPPRERKSNNWQTSADGKRAGATFPWPDCGSASLPQDRNRFVRYGVGCWPQIARDNSYRLFHFYGGKHNKLAMFNATGTKAWFVRCVPNPARSGAENPRWANDARFVVATDQHWHSLLPGIWLGRFNEDFTAFEAWLCIASRGDNSEPDCWLASASSYPPEATVTADLEAARRHVSREDIWPGPQEVLAFAWGDVTSDNALYGGDGRIRRRCIGTLREQARPAQNNSVDVTGGYLLAEGLDAAFVKAFQVHSEFSLEMTLTPEEQDSGTVAVFGPERGPANVRLKQEGHDLVVELTTSETGAPARAELGSLMRERIHPRSRATVFKPRQHVLVTYRPGETCWYTDGVLVTETNVLKGDLGPWKPGVLMFGDVPDRTDNWKGRLEGIALHDRALSADRAAAQYTLYCSRLMRDVPGKPLKVEGRLLEMTPLPTLRQIQPYPRALVVYAYRIARQSKGITYDETVHVAHWCYLDSKPVEHERKVGETYELCLEKAEWHPYLEAERMISALSDFDATLYVDVSR